RRDFTSRVAKDRRGGHRRFHSLRLSSRSLPGAGAQRAIWAARRVPMVIPARYHPGMAMTLRLTDDDEKILAELARAEGISRQEATVRAIREAAARRGHERAVQDLSPRARTRYAALLERLAQCPRSAPPPSKPC